MSKVDNFETGYIMLILSTNYTSCVNSYNIILESIMQRQTTSKADEAMYV